MSNLREYHMVDNEAASSRTAKTIGAVVIALVILAIGGYGYEAGWWAGQPQPAVSDNDLPSPGAP